MKPSVAREEVLVAEERAVHDENAQNHALRAAIEMGIARQQMVPGSLPYVDAGEIIDRALRIAEEV